MKKNAVFALLFLVLAGGAIALKVQIWVLFLPLAVYNLYRIFRPLKPPVARPVPPNSVAYGVLGEYDIEDDGELDSYGLYIRLRGGPVFVDIKEDRYVETRKQKALALYESSAIVEQNLERFISENPAFQSRIPMTIGLHSKDLDRAEVFWDPDGYTLMNGFDFVSGER